LADEAQSDGLEYLSDPEGLPENSVVDMESTAVSDGQGHVYEDEDDGDHEKDEDYVMHDDNSENSSDEEFNCDVDVHDEPLKGKGKAIKVSTFFPILTSKYY
jgi:hypothetical protein